MENQSHHCLTLPEVMNKCNQCCLSIMLLSETQLKKAQITLLCSLLKPQPKPFSQQLFLKKRQVGHWTKIIQGSWVKQGHITTCFKDKRTTPSLMEIDITGQIQSHHLLSLYKLKEGRNLINQWQSLQSKELHFLGNETLPS